MSKNIIDKIIKKDLTDLELLALLSAASVLRKKKIFRHILFTLEERKFIRKKIYEIILQTYLFAGFPSALISLKILNEISPINFNKKIKFQKIDYRNIGVKTCIKIYGEKFNKLIKNVNTFSPDLSEWLITEGYGKVLSREGATLKERELAIISILSVQKFEDQLYSHIKGTIRQKVSLKTIKKVIINLELLGNNSYTKFGLKVLNNFIKNTNDYK